ncbi:acyl-homoserine-lactone synthase [Roseivivax isoporae]|uniref:Acyl-homoserine-lactone synthase n=1 Tax=Roseivivax isoporae LMG 25204 TaxID=1449351 RepID=X7FF16_9RHOB|nr:acyl-homoserine-lactone synthase [Roseivivax isoporae]ETX30666.1 autoinducer synthase [Roseivivax isoporae LMG 25204]
MIIVIDGLNRCDFEDVLADVFELRARVFRDRLGWDVEVTEDGREVDHFDALDPAYVVSLDASGRAVGCMRLLQTLGPNMLNDVFHEILDGEPAPRDPQTWEATRFCVDINRLDNGRGRNSVSFVTSEVMIGAFEYARQAGVKDAVAVIDPVMNRLMKRSNNAPHGYLGTPKNFGVATAMAALMDCSEERISGIRSFSGIDYDVFLGEAEARALVDAGRSTEAQVARAANVTELRSDRPRRVTAEDRAPASHSVSMMVSYCRDQLATARTEDERRAALSLLQSISTTMSPEDWNCVRQHLEVALDG